MSHQVRVSGAHQIDTFKLGAIAGSEASQQMSQGIPSLAATHWVLAYLCWGGVSGIHQGETSNQDQTDQGLAL